MLITLPSTLTSMSLDKGTFEAVNRSAAPI